VITSKNFVAVIQKDKESGMYVGIIPSVVGAHTMGETLDELQVKMQEVLELCLDEMDSEDIALLPDYEMAVPVGVNA
jgi:predicted RNase H-like HicB family nuclease